jgi:hypothetical protein
MKNNSNLNQTVNRLIDNGYKEFTIVENHDLYDNCDRFFQKKVIDGTVGDVKTKYFIDAYVYDLSKFNSSVLNPIRISFKINFYDKDRRNHQLTLTGDDWESLESLENHIHEFFVRNEFINDPYN